MSGNEIISRAELTAWLESANTGDEFRGCAELLIHAMNEWPAAVLLEPVDFLEELYRQIGKSLTLGNINAYLNALEFRTASDSGRMEAIASVLDMFDAYLTESDITLNTILDKLTKHYRTSN